MSYSITPGPSSFRIPYPVNGPAAVDSQEVISAAKLDPILRQLGDSGLPLAREGQGQPVLSQPRTALTPQTAAELRAWLEQQQRDGGLIDSVDTLANQLEQAITKALARRSESAEEPAFDISGLSMPAAALLIQILDVLKLLRTADNRLSTMMSQVSFAAVKMEAAATRREGDESFKSAIGGAAFQLGLAGTGAAQNVRGIKKQSNMLKLDAKATNNIKTGVGDMQPALKRPSVTQPTADNPALTRPGSATPDALPVSAAPQGTVSGSEVAPAASRGAIPADNPPLPSTAPATPEVSSQEPITQASSPLPETPLAAQERSRSQASSDLLAQDRLRVAAQQDLAMGQFLIQNATVAANLAQGIGQLTITEQRAQQQLSQANSKVADRASQETLDSSNRANTLLQEIMRMIDTVAQSRHAVNGTIAGNIRA